MQDDLLSVKLLINEDLQVVLLLVNVDWHVNARALNFNWDRLRIVLILEEQSEALINVAKLQRDEGELDFSAWVALNLSCALERHSRKETVEFKLSWMFDFTFG